MNFLLPGLSHLLSIGRCGVALLLAVFDFSKVKREAVLGAYGR